MNIENLKTLCEGTSLIVHNARFEHKWLLSRGIDAKITDDTYLLAYMVDERLPLDLQSLCLKFGVDVPFKKEHGTSVSLLTGDRLIERNTRDARNTYILRDILWSKLDADGRKVYSKVLLPATRSLAKIENNGMCYSPEVMTGVIEELKDKIRDLDIHSDPVIKEFNSSSNKPFNIDSWMHRLIVVYDILGYTPLDFPQAMSDSGNPSTGIRVLKKLLKQKHTDTLAKIIDYSSYQGWKENYEKLEKYCDKCGDTHVANVEGKHYVYSNLRLGDTTTGRVKSDHPNMQNNPSREGGWTRRGFISRHPNGILVEADYDQIELKILAGLSGETVLIDGFLRGEDLHEKTYRIAYDLPEGAELTKEQRDEGKTLNYAIPFGRGASGIAFDTYRTEKEARKWLKRFWKLHPTLKNYLTKIPKDGIIKSPTGMKRNCETWTQAKNFRIQNTALVVLLIAINRMIDVLEGMGVTLALCIHDSLLFDIEDRSKLTDIIPIIRELMEFKPYELFSWMPIPFTVSFKAGENWGNLKKI